ncbi:MAG: hypothetical protein NG784_14200 [Candidatus Jettenia sp.]|nr:hypothetical protein [Candidatus Jettenia sp.]
MSILKSKSAKISYTDPHIPEVNCHKLSIKSEPLSQEILSKADCSVIVTDHSSFDYGLIVSNSKLIVDTRNALKGVKEKCIVRL